MKNLKPTARFTFVAFFSMLILTACSTGKAKEGYIRNGDVSLFYKEMGAGAPIIILHGGPGFGFRYLEPHLRFLSEKFKVIFFDQRGCGRSGGDGSTPVSMEQLVDDIEYLRKTKGYERINLLGHSFGSILALEYARKYPEKCGSLALISSEYLSTVYWPRNADISRLSSDEKDAFNRIVREGAYKIKDPDILSFYFRCLFKTAMYDGSQAERIDLGLDESRIDKMFNVMEELRPFLKESLYSIVFEKELQAPVLIVQGEKDIFSPDSAMHLHDRLPNSIFIIYNEAGHFPFIEKEYDFKQDIIRFFTMYAK